MESFELPEVDVVRERIESCKQHDARTCLMAGYLFCARISELISRHYISDYGTKARGPFGNNAQIDVFQQGDIKEDVVIFTIRTAKRHGRRRPIALPLNPVYEPWTKIVYDYYQNTAKNKPVFDFNRQEMWRNARITFENLRYPIERYMYYVEEGGIKLKKTRDLHSKHFATHALRHVRATELVKFYGFVGADLSTYGGWTLQTALQVSSSIERYTHLDWRGYFPKLLKKRR